jgi:hypothetical protein
VAFPVIEAVAESAQSSPGTSHPVTLPAGIAATDLVLIIFVNGAGASTLNALTDWTELLDENNANGFKIIQYTGAGVPSNPTFTSTSSHQSAAIALRISNAVKSPAPQVATTATGAGLTPDPPSITPTGGTVKDYLFIAACSSQSEQADNDTWANSPPTNYTPNPPHQKTSGTLGTSVAALLAVASRQLNTGAAQDPGTFSVDSNANWRAQHICVHPIEIQTIEAAGTGGGDASVLLHVETGATFLFASASQESNASVRLTSIRSRRRVPRRAVVYVRGLDGDGIGVIT